VASDSKSAAAFRTIGEVAALTGVAPHILRYWEGRFPQLRPVTRAGNRRYYRPADVTLVERIDKLLNRDGYTVKGVQQLLASERGAPAAMPAPEPVAVPTDAIRAVRDMLVRALREDGAA
jgi:DNA-binding transcriptional MerR regulator